VSYRVGLSLVMKVCASWSYHRIAIGQIQHARFSKLKEISAGRSKMEGASRAVRDNGISHVATLVAKAVEQI